VATSLRPADRLRGATLMARRSSAELATRLLPPLLALVAALVAWRPLLDNYFFADDFLHLFDLVTLDPVTFLTRILGGHLLVVSNAVFAAMYHLFGTDPRPWFGLVLLTHLLSVLLLDLLILRLTEDWLLGCLGATLWGTSPALEGALGWYSVYGQVLLTTLVLGVAWSLAGVVASGRPVSTRRALAWGAVLAAGAACFGTGLGVAGAFPLVALVALPAEQRAGRAAVLLALTAAAVFLVYAVLRQQPPALDLGGSELLSPGAILAATPAALTLGVALLGYSASTLVLGPLGLDSGYPDAATLAAGAAIAVLLVAGGAVADATRRRRLLWLGVLLLAACGAIAAGRAPIVTSFGLSIAHAAAWTRYHYLLMAVLTALVCVSLDALRAWRRAGAPLVAGGAAAWLAARLVLLAVQPHAIDHHDAERAETADVLRGIREAVAATPPGATAVIRNRAFNSARIPRLFPGWAGVFVIYFPENAIDGRTVRFVGRGDDMALAHQRGGRIAEVLPRP
jgi:hypothetical protein